MYRRTRNQLRNRFRRVTCRYVSYSTAVEWARFVSRNPLGKLRAYRKSRGLFQFLDSRNISYDPRDVATRQVMRKLLFPWAYCRFIKCPKTELDRWVRVTGIDRLEPVLNDERGLLLVACHFGPGHLAKYVLGAKGYRVYNVRRNDSFARSYNIGCTDCRFSREIHLRYDKSPGLLQTTSTVRDLLRRGETVACALDGKVGSSDGIWLSLMGVERPFRTALPLIASLTNSRIAPVFATLNMDGGIDIEFHYPFPERASEASHIAYSENVVRGYVEKVNEFCEAQPSQISLDRILGQKMNDKLARGSRESH